MTSEPVTEAFVWNWLPGESAPVVAGRLMADGDRFTFTYGRSYRERPDAIPLYLPELPLQAGPIVPRPPLLMAGALRDASPDAWGRRVIQNRMFGKAANEEPGELTYLMQSGLDRVGALDFQVSPTDYQPRGSAPAPLEELLASAERVERGVPITPELDQALFHGSSIGGARPKALVRDGGRSLIAKFSSAADTYPVVKAEFVAMRLAKIAGIDVAPVELVNVSGKDVLLVVRFDRLAAGQDEQGQMRWHRRAMVSALTILGLDEMQARYASYQDLAEVIRHRFKTPTQTLHELFARLTFNILVGNVDDHARNHAAFWDGCDLMLTPAYDICPQPRTGGEASQAMLIVGQQRLSRLDVCLAAAPDFHLDQGEAIAIVANQIAAIAAQWPAIADEAGLARVERTRLWGRSLLNPYAFEGLEGATSELAIQAEAARASG
jgi:serine/threonine-protein kinase HipA